MVIVVFYVYVYPCTYSICERRDILKKVISIMVVLFMLFTLILNMNEAKAIDAQPLTIGNITNARIGDYVVISGYPDDVCRLLGDNYLISNESYGSISFSSNGQNSYQGSYVEEFINDWSAGARTSSYLSKIFIDYPWGVGNETNEGSETIINLSSFPSYSDCRKLIDNGVTLNYRVWTRTPVAGTVDKVWVADLISGTLDNSVTVRSSEDYTQVLNLNPQVRVSSGSGTQVDPYIVTEPAAAPSQPDNGGPSITGIKLDCENYVLNENSNRDIKLYMTFSDGSRKLLVEASKYNSYMNNSKQSTGLSQSIIVTGDEITYTSSNPNVAYVNIFGKLVSQKKGATVITIKCGNWTYDATVNVK